MNSFSSLTGTPEPDLEPWTPYAHIGQLIALGKGPDETARCHFVPEEELAVLVIYCGVLDQELGTAVDILGFQSGILSQPSDPPWTPPRQHQ